MHKIEKEKFCTGKKMIYDRKFNMDIPFLMAYMYVYNKKD